VEVTLLLVVLEVAEVVNLVEVAELLPEVVVPWALTWRQKWY
jgi:hypothetical protein